MDLQNENSFDTELSLRMDELTDKQRHFVISYLNPGADSFLNASESARIAGYSNAYAQGYEILRKSKIRGIVNQFFSELSMDSNEVLFRLSAMAQANIGQFFKLEHGDPVLDFEAIKAKGWLVRSCYQMANGKWRIELYDSQRALELVGKARNLFSERIDMNVHQNNDLDEALERSFRLAYGDPDPVIEGESNYVDKDLESENDRLLTAKDDNNE